MIVVHVTQNWRVTFPAETHGWHAHDDGDLTVHNNAGQVACFARGQWTAVITIQEAEQ